MFRTCIPNASAITSIVDALAGTNAVRPQVDLFGATYDVHPVCPGKSGQLGHQLPELGSVAWPYRGLRPFLIPHPAFCLPVHVHNADRLHCYRLAGPLEEGAITIPNPIPLIMIPRSALPRLPNTKPPIVLAPPACSIRSWDNRG